MAIHTLEEAIAHDFWIVCVARDVGRQPSRRLGRDEGDLADETSAGVARVSTMALVGVQSDVSDWTVEQVYTWWVEKESVEDKRDCGSKHKKSWEEKKVMFREKR